MKQKRLVMLILCFAMLLALPLTVKADSSKTHAGGVMPPFDEELLDLEEMRAGIAELGFKDGIFWATLIHDGQDTEEIDPNAQIEQAYLEPGKFYTVEFALVAIWDEAERTRNAETFLQARFPQVVVNSKPSSFGAAVFGDQVHCVAQTTPIIATENLRIHYVEDSAKFLSMAVRNDFEKISAEDLLESESGLCLYPILNTGGRTDMPMTMAFVSYSIYTEPLESGGFDEYQPMFWDQSPPDGEDYTPASATTVSRVDHHGKPIRNYNVVVIMAIILGICKLVGLFLFLRHKQIKKVTANADLGDTFGHL